tara:strand:- start:130 stop:543 length:414 start_codon:yes stop_codon:yes gene_type:complete
MKKIHKISFNVYYEDTDSTGFVYHTTYLRFAERARTELLKKSFSDVIEILNKDDFFFVVKEIGVNYVKPSFLFDELIVVTYFLGNRIASLDLHQEIVKDKKIICKMDVKLVLVDKKSKRPMKIPRNIISRFKSMEVV